MPLPPCRLAARLLLGLLLPWASAQAQERVFTHADTLRGSLSPERTWWDVAFYDLHVTVDPASRAIHGWNRIVYRVVGASRAMQIDLQTPLEIDSIVQDGHRLTYRRDGDAFFVTPATAQAKGTTQALTVYYHGAPKIAPMPPWQGGVVWTTDDDGHPWFATACQLTGASVWWPNKDTQADEPDSQHVSLTVPDSLQAVSNGRLRGVEPGPAGWTTYHWAVTEPINNYGVAAYVGRYTKLTDTFQGESGPLSLTYWPLSVHVAEARTQFPQAKTMLACFEHWFGPYPWYQDGYQLVEAPFLGMEHQSAVAYGNGYANGYRGSDLSGTGYGNEWDYIIIHESGHEWFGNNITSADIADMWVHESFTTYAEALFVECQHDKAAGAAYVTGTRSGISNSAPIVGRFGVNEEGSQDMYPKGANMLHTIRQIVGNDSTWRAILRGLNSTFRHQVVTGKQVEAYISAQAHTDLSKVFEQYLTTTQVPTFEYRVNGQTLEYRWTDVVPGFDMPLRVTVGGKPLLVKPREAWQTTALPAAGDVQVDENFYVNAQHAP